MTLYHEKDLEKLHKRIKAEVAAISAAWAAVIALSVVLCCFTSLENALAFRIIVTAAWALVGWFTIGCLFVGVFPAKKRARIVKSLLNSQKLKYSGKVVKTGETVTFAKASVTETVIENDGVKTVLYWESPLQIPFAEGDNITCLAADKIICEFEVNA